MLDESSFGFLLSTSEPPQYQWFCIDGGLKPKIDCNIIQTWCKSFKKPVKLEVNDCSAISVEVNTLVGADFHFCQYSFPPLLISIK